MGSAQPISEAVYAADIDYVDYAADIDYADYADYTDYGAATDYTDYGADKNVPATNTIQPMATLNSDRTSQETTEPTNWRVDAPSRVINRNQRNQRNQSHSMPKTPALSEEQVNEHLPATIDYTDYTDYTDYAADIDYTDYVDYADYADYVDYADYAADKNVPAADTIQPVATPNSDRISRQITVPTKMLNVAEAKLPQNDWRVDAPSSVINRNQRNQRNQLRSLPQTPGFSREQVNEHLPPTIDYTDYVDYGDYADYVDYVDAPSSVITVINHTPCHNNQLWEPK